MMICWSIPIAFRIPICRRRFTVLMKITMKTTTMAMIRLTSVEMALMMLKLWIAWSTNPPDFSRNVQTSSWTP